MLEMRIHGRGGQGVVTLCELLARTALKTGRQAQTMPFFGVERRGAAVKSSLRIDDNRIKVRSQSFAPGYLTLMHANLLPAATVDGPHNGAVLVVNSPAPIGVNNAQWYIDAVDIAVRNGLVVSGEPFINVPMMGAICRIIGLPADKMEQTILEQWGEKAGANIAAAREAFESVKFKDGRQTI